MCLGLIVFARLSVSRRASLVWTVGRTAPAWSPPRYPETLSRLVQAELVLGRCRKCWSERAWLGEKSRATGSLKGLRWFAWRKLSRSDTTYARPQASHKQGRAAGSNFEPQAMCMVPYAHFVRRLRYQAVAHTMNYTVPDKS
jgi:hypothetical protein